MDDNRVLPTNVDAERLVLGSIMLDDSTMHDVRGVLVKDDYSLDKHRRIWDVMCFLYDSGVSVDRVTIANELINRKELECCDGLGYLVSLDDGLPKIHNLDSYVQILKDKATLRRIAITADSLITRACGGIEAPQAILNDISDLSVSLAPAERSTGLLSAKELVDAHGLQSLLAPRREKGIPFPWSWMTGATCGMLPGELWVLAGGTSTGKTAAAIQTAVHAARKGVGVPIFSLEMSSPSIFTRATYQVGRIDSERAKHGALTADERAQQVEAAKFLYDLPLYFDDSGAATVPSIHAQIRRKKLQVPIGLVVVDYLQLLGAAGRHNTRAEVVGANSRALKLMAMEFGCTVLLLSQFKRTVTTDQKGNVNIRRPILEDLKESGDIENDANGVWFIHRPRREDAEQIECEFILAKQRDGVRDVSEQFWFFPQFQRFDGREN